MRTAKIYFKGKDAGLLTEHDDGSFTFRYNRDWMNTNDSGISLTLPNSKQEYHSNSLFPFFFNMLPEGANKDVICKYLRIDERDYFGLLMAAARNDTIGAVTVEKIRDDN